jgi:glycosyltransferase involved in cell wall biosynthesis
MGQPYWFFRYFSESPQVDIIDISSFPWLEALEKNKLRFYIWQTLRVLPNLHQYDLIVSHGMQSGVVLSLWRRFFKTKAKHIVFDIGSFNSAAETGAALKLMQYASKSIDGIIYHTSSQMDYYQQFFPWIVEKSRFIRFGTDPEFFDPQGLKIKQDINKYIICVGYSKRDWNTVVTAWKMLNVPLRLRLVGRVIPEFQGVQGLEQIPFIPIRELMGQIHNAAFCVLPLESFNYSYGQMTLMQQMALGKCVITARVPSLVDYVRDGDTAVLYTPGNAEELCEKMRELSGNPGLCRKIGSAGRRYLLEECNEMIMAREIEAYIMRVMQE